jgi:hypothetical protein
MQRVQTMEKEGKKRAAEQTDKRTTRHANGVSISGQWME